MSRFNTAPTVLQIRDIASISIRRDRFHATLRGTASDKDAKRVIREWGAPLFAGATFEARTTTQLLQSVSWESLASMFEIKVPKRLKGKG